MSLLSVDDLHAGYGRGNVLHGVSLDLEPGGVAVVLGANGAGKTTMMRRACRIDSAPGNDHLQRFAARIQT